jgi:sulfatase maturation enzyme AslB (radical SAM superfamily)
MARKMTDFINFSPSLCVTHNCNLGCVYCYQKHEVDSNMSIDTAKRIIDWIFSNVPENLDVFEIHFIGGEPLLEFDLIKKTVEYACAKYRKENKNKYVFFATTNGTILTNEMKKWFEEHKGCFVLGLSLDGIRDVHNHNRNNSFDKIDIKFFRQTWPNQSVKMTLSEYSLYHFAESVKYIHSLGFPIGGVNLFEGNFDWDKDEYIYELAKQFKEIVDYYVENNNLKVNQMFDKKLSVCESKIKATKKWCGIGKSTPFFDINGEKYPCNFMTPMTFSQEDIDLIKNVDYLKDEDFIDDDCFNNCYIYPICPTCYGANFLENKMFNKRIKSKCRIQKLIALFIADLQAKRILKDRSNFENTELFYTIEAIKRIELLYKEDFAKYI